MEHGLTTRWKVLVSSHGQTAEDTKVNTLTIRKKVKESFIGQMVENTTEAGRMANNMALALIPQLAAKANKVSGRRESVSIGCKINESFFDY